MGLMTVFQAYLITFQMAPNTVSATPMKSWKAGTRVFVVNSFNASNTGLMTRFHASLMAVQIAFHTVLATPMYAWKMGMRLFLSLIHISEPSRLRRISYAVF